MSRNFELLRKVGKERETSLNHRVPAARVVPSVSAESTAPRTPVNGKRLLPDVDPRIRGELIKLVQRVFLSPLVDAPRAVLFSAVEHGAGCSRICVWAGEALAAQVPGSVCLVDADLRSPSLHQLFQLDDTCGLNQAVTQPGPIRKFVQQISHTNLWVLPSGSRTSDPHMLLVSDPFVSRLRELCAQFDYVLINTAPIGLYSDATVLGQLADGIVLVLEANSTRRELAKRVKDSLEAANLGLLGAVLNKRSFPLLEKIYRQR